MVEHKAPKEKKSGKKQYLGRNKKTFFGGGLVVVIAIAGIFIGFSLISDSDKPEIFIWGTGGLGSIDPQLFESRENFAILENIVESLFDYEFTAEGSNVVPSLALGGNWSVDKLKFTCYHRQAVKFHDV